MYSVYADGIRIYDDSYSLPDEKLIDPTLTMEDSSAGSLEMTLPVGNKGYASIRRMTSDITVAKNGSEIWWGRVLSEEQNFQNDRILTCEGALAFLNDVAQPLAQYSGMIIRSYIERLLAVYNQNASPNRQFRVGAVTVGTGIITDYITNYEKTIECLNKLITEYGGHFRVRKEGGVYILDYLLDYPNTNSQTIEFGKNLLDFTRSWNTDEFATVVIPLGEKLDESQLENIDERLTVASVNFGDIHVVSYQAVAQYGWIEKVVEFDGVTDPTQLLAMGQSYLSDIQFDSVEITLTALDLNYLSAEYEDIKLLDKVRAISEPHGMNHLFPVRKISIPLDRPEDTQFTLGDAESTTLTNVNNEVNRELINAIRTLPSKTSILDAARANAAEIMSMATNGFITIHQDGDGADAVYISSERNYTQSQNLWKWSMTGLGYSDDGGQTWKTAITMDGAIVADFITAGHLSGDLITAGTVTANQLSVEYKNSVASAISDSAAAVTQSFQVADGRLSSRITQNSADITGLSGDISDLSDDVDDLQSDVSDISTEIYQSGTGIKARVSANEQDIASLNLDLNGLSLSYSQNLGGESGSLVLLDRNGVTISSVNNIALNGLVTFSNLQTSGQTVINGDNITTGTIDSRDVILRLTDSTTGDGGHIYFKDGDTLGATLYYDNTGSGTIYEAQNRVMLTTEGLTAIKMISGGGMSLQSNYGMYLYSIYNMQLFTGGTMYLNTANNSTAYLNGYEIITTNNISSYVPSTAAAVFG